MTKMVLVFLLISFLCLSGCQPTKVAGINQVASDEIVDQIKYTKDKAGICYAAISSRTYGGHYVVSITAVDCLKVGL